MASAANKVEPIDEMMHGLMINEEGVQDFNEIQEREAEIMKDPTVIARQYVFLLIPFFIFCFFHFYLFISWILCGDF